MENYSQWKLVTNFFRENKGNIVTRKELFKEIDYHICRFHKKPLGSVGYSECTIDSYRRYLTAAGFLKHVGRGKYFVNENFPPEETCTIDFILWLAYDYDY